MMNCMFTFMVVNLVRDHIISSLFVSKRNRFNLAPTPSPKLRRTTFICIHVCLKDLSRTWRVYVRNWRRFRYSEFHGSRPIIGRMQCLYLHLDSRANVGYQSTSFRGRNKRIYDWYSFCDWSSAKVTNVSALWHPENKLWQVCFWALLFVHAEVLRPGPRFWSDEPLLGFFLFQTKWASTPSLPY